ncbi:hypothetical protein RvY_14103 [Ramazzottius varieornatus]|uniref:Uncharacterized protein n=1 Tax=Ramazzottius varieornatus TaxID=947166 RepID=A0A1D1VXH4_RAMVA|nr:hypothetical protein RvY_14103 [Ramazzottius varieornatus]
MEEFRINVSDYETPSAVVHIGIITLGLLYAAEMGSLYYITPAYNSALDDIKQTYPRLRVSQHFVADPAFRLCGDLMPDSDNLLARFYYGREPKWRRANFAVFLSNEAGT